MIRFVFGRYMRGAMVGAGLLGCSTAGDGPIGTSAARLTVATNAQAEGFDMHYASVALGMTNAVPHWVIAYDNCSNDSFITGQGYLQCDAYNKIGWAYSTDVTGAPGTWTANHPTLIGLNETTTWGLPPGVPACGGTFNGFEGDPTIAQIGNPPDGTKLMMASVTSSNFNQTTCRTSDITSLLSTDGGHSWGAPQWMGARSVYVDTSTSGANVDQPLIATNAKAPYSTFVAWSNNVATMMPAPHGWITSINNVTYQPGSSSSVGTWTGVPKPVLNAPTNSAVRPKIAVGTIPWNTGLNGCNSGAPTHEIVYVVWSDNPWGRECGVNPPGTVNWYLAVYDNTSDTWYGSIHIDIDNNWPFCVGGSAAPYNSNISNADIATNGPSAAIAYDRSSPAEGTRINVRMAGASCSNNNLIVSLGPKLAGPDPCYTPNGWNWCPPGSGGGGGNGVNGTTVVNDQWGPHVAYLSKSGVDEVLVTWYDTAGDVTNTKANVNGALNSNGFTGSPFYLGVTPTSFAISKPTHPCPPTCTEQVPWTTASGMWWDYQGIGVDPGTVSGTLSFLPAWGGDARLFPYGGASGIWTARITSF